MKTYRAHLILLLSISSTLFFSCHRPNNTTQIGDNTFVHNDKIYRIIDNQIREIGDLNASDIKKFEVLKPVQRDLGTHPISQLKIGASVSLKALYRGNFLYYGLRINNLNDLRENYNDGDLNIVFVDEYGFEMHSTTIDAHDLTGDLGENGVINYLYYNGKTEMSTDINSAIKDFQITTRISHR
jgi:hypothetical protein